MATCQNVEDTAKDELMPRRSQPVRGTNICLRCKTAKGQIIVRHCVYCKDCFYPTVSLKFRRALATILTPRTRSKRSERSTADETGSLLLGYSGGIGSSILLDMVWHRYVDDADENAEKGLAAGNAKRRPSIWKKIRVAYIEQCAAYDDTADRIEDVRRIVQRYPEFELVTLRIEDAFDSSWWHDHGPRPQDVDAVLLAMELPSMAISRVGQLDGTPGDRLRAYLAALPTPTAVSDAISTLTQVLLQYLAQSTHSSHLLLGTSLTSLSVSLIAGMSQGGGYNVKEVKDQVWGEVRVARPLKEIGAKECAAWLWWRRLEVVPRLNTAAPRSTIQRLTRDFVVGLERDFPSTVSTIAKTCEKLEPKGSASGPCPICQRPAQEGIQTWKAGISILALPDHVEETQTGSQGTTKVLDGLCYSCHTGWTSRSNRSLKIEAGLVPLPLWVGESLNSGSMVSREGMRDSIKEFLLDQDIT